MHITQVKTAFLVTVLSTTMLLLTLRYGTLAVAGFFALWALYFLAWPSSVEKMFRTLLPWVLPLLALASAAWSNMPDLTARYAVEWLLVIGVTVVMVSTLPVDRLLAAWMLALVPVVIIGGFVGGTQLTETGDVALVGIFGSKNNFALHISQLLFVCLAVLANSRQPRPFRLIALLACGIAPLLLWKAKSVGALVVFIPSVVLMGAILFLSRMTYRLRPIVIAGSLIVGLVAAIAIAPVASVAQDAMLSTVGKNQDLTGRGLLWQRAGVLIEQRPALGVGYAAFWVQGNPEAEALWRAEHIASRTGFHFHNFYYETLVELGYVGLIISVTVLGIISIAVLSWGIRSPGPESAFFCALMLFLWMRSYVELDLMGGFGLNALIVPAAWICARRALRTTGSTP